MSFDATNPEHHEYFTQTVLKALTNSWLGNAWTYRMSTEGRRINDREEQNIRDRAKQELSEWMAQIWQDGHDTAPSNTRSTNEPRTPAPARPSPRQKNHRTKT